MKRLMFLIVNLIFVLPNFLLADDSGGSQITSSATNTVNIATGMIVSEGESWLDCVKLENAAWLLAAGLAICGMYGSVLMDKLITLCFYVKDLIPAKCGFNPESGFYSFVFWIVWVSLMCSVWVWASSLHKTARDKMKRWNWVRFIAIGSGFWCVVFHLTGVNASGGAYACSALLPMSGLMLSLVISFFYARKYSRWSRYLTFRVLGLVLLDFAIGFLIASFIKFLFAIGVIAAVLWVLNAFGNNMGAGSGHSSSGNTAPSQNPSQERVRPPSPPPAPPPVVSTPEPKREPMVCFPEWFSKTVVVYNQRRQRVCRLNFINEVVSVQCSGTDDATLIVVTLNNGKTVVYNLRGQKIR